MNQHNNVVFFDGICNLCNQSVDILVRVDRHRKLRYSSLQGKLALEVLGTNEAETSDSFVYLLEGKTYRKSEAFVLILKQLGGIYRIMGHILSALPYSFLNVFYDFVAKNRYRLFGKRESCRIPTKEEADLFIE